MTIIKNDGANKKVKKEKSLFGNSKDEKIVAPNYEKIESILSKDRGGFDSKLPTYASNSSYGLDFTEVVDSISGLNEKLEGAEAINELLENSNQVIEKPMFGLVGKLFGISKSVPVENLDIDHSLPKINSYLEEICDSLNEVGSSINSKLSERNNYLNKLSAEVHETFDESSEMKNYCEALSSEIKDSSELVVSLNEYLSTSSHRDDEFVENRQRRFDLDTLIKKDKSLINSLKYDINEREKISKDNEKRITKYIVENESLSNVKKVSETIVYRIKKMTYEGQLTLEAFRSSSDLLVSMVDACGEMIKYNSLNNELSGCMDSLLMGNSQSSYSRGNGSYLSKIKVMLK